VWLDWSPAGRRFPRQKGLLDVDVVIVGAGITGAIAAYLFSNAGIRIAVLESKRAGCGSTAASTALLMQEADRDFAELARRYGARSARTIWKALSAATRGLLQSIRTLKLDCDLRERDSLYFTLDPGKKRTLRQEFRRRKNAGLPGRWLTAAAFQRRTGIRGQGAIATSGNGEVNPIRACRGFLEAARARGAKIFERSPARRITVSRDGVVVRTSGGKVRARCVIVATGYATREFKPLVGRFRMKDTYVIATRPLPLRVRRLLRSRSMFWDTDRPYHYLRWTRDGRLLIGGEDTNHRSSRGSRARLANARGRLLEYLARICPDLASERPEYAWEGLFAETPDGLPYVGTHSRYPKHLFALGYGGNGMTASFLAAQLLLKRYRGRPSSQEPLFAFNRGR
jgi:glycine/D-amino acid oxidase-like deaminating enzyme